MKYSALLISALAVLAKAVQITNTDFTVTENQPYTITWTGSTDPVTIKLKTGASNDLKDVQTITSSGSGGSFTWTPENLPSGTYAFEITDSSGDVNYSSQFSYQGTGTLTATSSTASSTASTASTTESSSSSSETKSTTSSARLTSSTMTPLTNSTTLSTSAHASTSRSSSTATTTSSSSTSTATEVPNTNNGQRVASSLALVLGAVAAFVAFN
jgi:hypothetical protein